MCVCVCVCVCACVCTRVYGVCDCVCVCMHMYICVCVCVCVCAHTCGVCACVCIALLVGSHVECIPFYLKCPLQYLVCEGPEGGNASHGYSLSFTSHVVRTGLHWWVLTACCNEIVWRTGSRDDWKCDNWCTFKPGSQ